MNTAEHATDNAFGDLVIGDELSAFYGDDQSDADYIAISPAEREAIAVYISQLPRMPFAETVREQRSQSLQRRARIAHVCDLLGWDVANDYQHQQAVNLMDSIDDSWRGYSISPVQSFGEMAA